MIAPHYRNLNNSVGEGDTFLDSAPRLQAYLLKTYYLEIYYLKMYLKTYHPKGPSIRVNKNRTGIKILNDQNEFMQQFVLERSFKYL
ncbi:unnamed protein product [Rhizophagus irregularis]|nr:unnamed protein product [Rhizophagus irregularis]